MLWWKVLEFFFCSLKDGKVWRLVLRLLVINPCTCTGLLMCCSRTPAHVSFHLAQCWATFRARCYLVRHNASKVLHASGSQEAGDVWQLAASEPGNLLGTRGVCGIWTHLVLLERCVQVANSLTYCLHLHSTDVSMWTGTEAGNMMSSALYCVNQ